MRDISEYLRRLVEAYPDITAVWLIGSRANCRAGPESDWDLLVFADEPTLQQLRIDGGLRDRTAGLVDLLVVYDNLQFEGPWPDTTGRLKRGNLDPLEWNNPLGWGWEQLSDVDAEYTETRPEVRRAKAQKLWSR